MQGQCVTLGSLGMKTHTTVQVKEVTFSLFILTDTQTITFLHIIHVSFKKYLNLF